MNMPTSKDTLDPITKAIDDYPQNTISGAVLGLVIRKAAPDLDLRAAVGIPPSGTGALSRFVDRFLSHVLVKTGRTAPDAVGGGDIMYTKVGAEALTSTSSSPDQTQTHQRGDYWNQFVRPSDPRMLVLIKTQDGYGLALQRGDAPPEGRIIPQVSRDELLSISREFIDQLRLVDGPLADTLAATNTYFEFVEVLRRAGNAFLLQWNQHRYTRLIGKFMERLSALDLSTPEQQQILSMLERSQVAAGFAAKLRPMRKDTAISSRANASNQSIDADSTHAGRVFYRKPGQRSMA